MDPLPTPSSILARPIVKQPIPSTIVAFKNHHVYVLWKNLLKFEGLRPGAKVAGLVKGSKVYLKSDVATIRGASRWKQEGLKVRGVIAVIVMVGVLV